MGNEFMAMFAPVNAVMAMSREMNSANTLFNSGIRPCSKSVHALSLKVSSKAAHAVQLLQYPAQLVDHIIKGLASPIFQVGYPAMRCRRADSLGERAFFATQFILSPIGIAANCAGRAVHIALHIILPLGAIDAAFAGQYAAAVRFNHLLAKWSDKVDARLQMNGQEPLSNKAKFTNCLHVSPLTIKDKSWADYQDYLMRSKELPLDL